LRLGSIQIFNRENVKKDLKRKSVQSLFTRFVANGISAALTMASTIVLARLLTPEEFGLFAMVAAVMEFARSFREIGLGTATVQRENITHEEVSVLFWINVGIGVVSMLLMCSLSSAVVWFYGNEELFSICMVSSTVFLFSGLTAQHRALLERQMHFGYLAIIYIGATILSIGVAILLALYGFSFWALVWRDLSFAGFYAAGTWVLCGWVPSLPRRNVNVRSCLRFGTEITGFDILQYFTRNVDRLLIGRFWGPTQLGLYTKAMQLVMMPVEHIRMTIMGVGLSPLSALQKDPERYRRFFCTLLSALTFLYMPLVVFVAIQSESLILVFLGEKWLNAAPLLSVFSLAAFLKPISSICHLIMVSYGMTKRYLRVGLLNSICMISSFAMGIQWGVIGVAYGYAFTSFALLIWELLYCLKGTAVRASDVIKTISIPVFSSVSAGILLIAIMSNIEGRSTLFRVFSSFIIIVVTYLGIWLCLPDGRKRLTVFWSYRVELFRKGML
jgi:O-antigen/teichoic acid export membrane protein